MSRRERGACRSEDAELLFPLGEGVLSPRRTEEARAVRRRCPVPRECRVFAPRAGEDDGARGGMSTGERRAAPRGGYGGRRRPRPVDP